MLSLIFAIVVSLPASKPSCVSATLLDGRTVKMCEGRVVKVAQGQNERIFGADGSIWTVK